MYAPPSAPINPILALSPEHRLTGRLRATIVESVAAELSYIIITPYTIVKSRTGGVISRLLSRVDLELCAAQVFAPSRELAEAYAANIAGRKAQTSEGRVSLELIGDYILQNFTPSEGRRHRVMMMLFRGEDACRKLTDLVGSVHPEQRSFDMLTGETIRDTYADLVRSKEDPEKVSYFEPAVLTPPHQRFAAEILRMFVPFIKDEPNIVENVVHQNPERIERTLVIIKPDNWRYPSSRPGAIIDMFSRTGLRIIGCKVAQMSVSEAVQFYGPVRTALEKKLAPVAAQQARSHLEERFSVRLDSATEEKLRESFGLKYAADQFSRIVEFMTGYRPDECPPEDRDKRGKVKSMVLVYEGEDAVQKIRAVLGPTDPTQAPGGTIRKEFGKDAMVNTAHASDSPENAIREMGILKIQQNDLADIILSYLESQSGK